MAESFKRGWQVNIAVVDSGANLVAFVRMDGAPLASIAIAEHKARTAAKNRRPTKVFEDAVQKSGFTYQLSLESSAPLGVPAAPAHRMNWCAWPAQPRSTNNRSTRLNRDHDPTWSSPGRSRAFLNAASKERGRLHR